jgi:hypothetical protein
VLLIFKFLQIHIVRFDSQNHIQQIKLYWDQGSLLKQVDVTGSRGRNWPIRDAKDLTRLITSTASAVVHGTVTPHSQTTVAENQEPAPVISPSKKYIKDPHSSLSLFSSEGADEPPAAAIPPRAAGSARPPPRAYNELFIGEDDGPPARSSSPTKGGVVAPKGGAGKNFQRSRLFDNDETGPAEEKPKAAIPPKAGTGKNFQRSRLFDDDETGPAEEKPKAAIPPKAGTGKNFQAIRLFDDDETVAAEEKKPLYKTHPNKYGHFELGDENGGQQETKSIPSRPKQRPLSQLDIADFATPEKPQNTKIRGQDVRHFGWSDNEEDTQETPVARPRVARPRRDAETHFQLEDDGAPSAGTGTKRIIGAAHNKGLGLYKDNLFDDEGNPTPHEPIEAESTSVPPNGAHRKKDFDSHWSTYDASPPGEQPKVESRPVSSDRAKFLKMMDSSWDSSWDTYDQSPEPKKKDAPPANAKAHTKHVSRNVNQRSWGFGDDEGDL